VAEDLHGKWLGGEQMQYTATNNPEALFPPIGLSTASDHGSWSRQPAPCASCAGGRSDLIYGDDPDGLVLCRVCRSPLFYCDLGGQG